MDELSADSYSQGSFIRVRDPSIIAYNRPVNKNEVKAKLLFNSIDSSLQDTVHSSIDDSFEQLQVYLRLKPSNLYHHNVYEISNDKKSLVCTQPNSQGKNNKILKYTFSRIYCGETGQKELFDHCIKEKLLNFMNGQNSTFFAYGTSGAGKTFTILGNEENPGIIPRALEYVFRTLPSMRAVSQVKPSSASGFIILNKDQIQREIEVRKKILNCSFEIKDVEHTYRLMQQRLSMDPVAEISGDFDGNQISIWVSFYEIYNEHVYDLLCFESKDINTQKPMRQKLQICADSNGKTFVKNLTSICVNTGLEAYKILQFGMHNIQYGSTDINNHSSRSHSIFTIKLIQYNEDLNECQLSHFNFCDLAGSERAKKSRTNGFRLKESANINHSLHVLGRCIKMIRDSKSKDKMRIPYRESKLTRIFQPALSGQECTSMIVNLNPDPKMFEENLHVLNFSSVAKEISISNYKSAKVPLDSELYKYKDSFDPVQMMLREEIERLRLQVEEQARDFEEREQKLREMYVEKMQDQLKEQFAEKRKCVEETKARCEERFKKMLARQEKNFQTKLEILQEAAAEQRRLLDEEVIDLTVEEVDEQLELQFENASLKKRIEDLEDEIKYLKELSGRDKQKINDLESKLTEKNILIAKWETDFYECFEKNEKLMLELNECKHENEEFQVRYSELAIQQQETIEQVEELEEKCFLYQLDISM